MYRRQVRFKSVLGDVTQTFAYCMCIWGVKIARQRLEEAVKCAVLVMGMLGNMFPHYAYYKKIVY